MDHLANAEIERLQAQLKRKDEDLKLARQQIAQLQTASTHQPQVDYLLSPSISEHYTDTHGDIRRPVVPIVQDALSGATSIPRSVGGKLHGRHHRDSQNSHQYQNGDEPHPHAMKRPRTMSQQAPSSQKMDRAASNLSTRSAGPFTGSTVSPPPTSQTTGLKPSEYDNYPIYNGYMSPQGSTGLMPQVPADKRQYPTITALAGMGSFPLTGELVDPAVWLAQHEELSPELDVPFPSTPHQRSMDAPNLSMNVSVCDSMTSGPTYDNTAPMTRQNSQFDDPSIVGGVRMMHADSQMSHTYFSDCSPQAVEYGETPSFLGKQPSREDALLAVGSRLATLVGPHYTPATPNEGLLMSSDMERSLSSTSSASSKSTSSLSVRAKDTLKQQNHRAQKAPLKPKPAVDESKAEPPSDEKNDGKAAITKTTKYVRPKQPKVFCELCEEHKEGFRGEHELRRHKDAKHQTMVKKFVCVDPQELGLPINVQVVNPLSKCKACKAKKKYGAYYNAAAHLRRTHFKEKPSRSKNRSAGANGGDDDKRGGKGGGDWPSMHELKNWMQEIYVHQDEQRPKEDDDADDETDGAQLCLGEVDMNTNAVGGSSTTLATIGMAHGDYSFPNPLTINTIHGDMSYIGTMPLSSADFTFNGSTNMPLTFNTEMADYPAINHMHPLSAAVSSSATVTPMSVFNDAQQHHFDHAGYYAA